MAKLFWRLFDGRALLRGQEPTGEIPDNRSLLRQTLAIAWPSTLESFLIALVGMVDTIMVGGLGAYAISAVGLTNQPKLLGMCVFISLNVAVSALVARRKGEDDRVAANRVMKQALVITLVLAVVVSAVFVIFADPILDLAGTNEDTHASSVAYMRIIMGGLVFNVVSMVINAAQRGVGNTKIAMRTNIVSNLVNIFFNYLFIGGKLGFPRLEVAGAAIATVIGTVFACGMSLYSVSRPESYLYLGFSKGFHMEKSIMKSIGSLGSSTLVEQIFLRVGFMVSAIIVARLGTTPFAAHQIGMNLTSLAFALGDGLSVAAVALVGQSLGAGRKDLARIYGNLCQRVGLLFAAMLSVLFALFGRELFSLFTNETIILDYGEKITSIAAFTVFLQISNVIFSGCLRGAGDVKYVAMVSLFSVALIRPISSYLFCYPLGLGLVGAWVSLALDLSVRVVLVFTRFAKGKWVDIKI